jgi:hypothetical protein
MSFPSGLSSLFRYRASHSGTQSSGSRFATLLASHPSQGNCVWILSYVGIFQRRAVQVLSDGLFNHSAGHCNEIMVLA